MGIQERVGSAVGEGGRYGPERLLSVTAAVGVGLWGNGERDGGRRLASPGGGGRGVDPLLPARPLSVPHRTIPLPRSIPFRRCIRPSHR